MSCDNWNKDSYPIVEKRFKLSQDSSSDVMLMRINDNHILVLGHILFYGSNSDFIIIEEKPRNIIPEILRHDESEKQFFKSTFSQYWIIKIENDSVFGPYNKIGYLKKRQIIGVPEKLKLNHSTLDFYIKGQRNDVGYTKVDPDVVDIKNLKGNNFAKVFPFDLFDYSDK